MKNLQINEKTAKEIYPGASEALKAILVETFGKKLFRKKEYTDFETFDDLCQAIGTTEIEFNKKWDPTVFDPSTIAFEKLKVCTRAYNPDWKFNAYDTNQLKYYPWFEVLSSGFGFSVRVASSLSRLRVSVRAFALSLQRKLLTPAAPFLSYLKIS